jgi:hypothetical protein
MQSQRQNQARSRVGCPERDSDPGERSQEAVTALQSRFHVVERARKARFSGPFLSFSPHFDAAGKLRES